MRKSRFNVYNYAFMAVLAVDLLLCLTVYRAETKAVRDAFWENPVFGLLIGVLWQGLLVLLFMAQSFEMGRKSGIKELGSDRKEQSANQKLIAGKQQLSAVNEQLVASEMQLMTTNHAMNERMKELSCLYEISRLLKNENTTIKRVFGKVVVIIRSSVQYPEITCVRIIIDDQEFRTENFEETAWRINCDININNERNGTIEVFYLEEKPKVGTCPFLKEERKFIRAVAEDIGRFIERKRIRDELSKKDSAMHTSINAIAFTDLEGNITYVNSSFLKMWNYENEKDVIGKPAVEFWEKEEDAVEVIKILADKSGWLGEMKAKKSNGLVFDVHLSASMVNDNKNKPLCMMASFIDISERRKAEEARMESELKYMTLFEGCADGIIIADVETKKFKYMNKAICEMLGYTEDEIAKKSVLDIHPKESLDHVIDEFLAQANGEKALAEDIPCLKKDGTILYADINTQPMVMGGRKYNVGFFRDITGRKRTEKEKTILEESLRQSDKLRAVGELAGGIAHDFNNILGAISGYAELIDEENRDENGKKIDPVLEKRTGIIMRASRRAADLISKLLAFSRRGKYRNELMDIHGIIGDVISLLKESVDRRILLRKKLSAENAVIKGDNSQIQNAILNLAINACDAIEQGSGVVLISTRNETLKHGQYSDKCKAGVYLLISVSDTGEGMDESIKKKVFEPFFTTKDVGEGTGLGLASVYGTVRSHNGEIFVESKVNKGTRFKIYLPCVEQKDENTINGQENVRVEMVKGEGSILIVDDEEMVRDVSGEMLENCGYTVHTCADGVEAVIWYSDNYMKTDIVILDVIMPFMSGIECFERLKEINPDVKVILVSGYSKDKKVRNCLEHGAVDFIEKPFDRYELSGIVADTLKGGRVSKEIT